jgi:hypothetical protein
MLCYVLWSLNLSLRLWNKRFVTHTRDNDPGSVTFSYRHWILYTPVRRMILPRLLTRKMQLVSVGGGDGSVCRPNTISVQPIKFDRKTILFVKNQFRWYSILRIRRIEIAGWMV